MAPYGDPPETPLARMPLGEASAGHVEAAEQLRPLLAVKIGRQGFAVVDDADRHVGLSIGQVCQLARGQDFHRDARMQTYELGKVRHEQVCCEGRRHRHPKKPAHALIAPEDARFQLVRRRLHLLREFEHLLARSRHAVARRQLFKHLRPEAFLELGDAPQHGRVIHPEPLGGGPHGAFACGGKKVTNVIPVDHGAFPRRKLRLPKAHPNTFGL
jgi:hypothetical protein